MSYQADFWISPPEPNYRGRSAVPPSKKIGNFFQFFLDDLAQGSKSKIRLGRPSSGSLGPIHAKDGVCAIISLDFIIRRPFWSGPHLLNRGIL